MYVSDRRFMKAVNLLQVAAHADGRDQVAPSQDPYSSLHLISTLPGMCWEGCLTSGAIARKVACKAIDSWRAACPAVQPARQGGARRPPAGSAWG